MTQPTPVPFSLPRWWALNAASWSIGDRHNAAIFYFNLGNLYRQQGDLEQARAHYEKAKALYEMVGVAQWVQRAAQALRRL